MTVNNPTYSGEQVKITNGPIIKLGGVAGATFQQIDLGIEIGMLFGIERLQREEKNSSGTWEKKIDASNLSMEIPLTLKQAITIGGFSQVKPMISAGYYLKLPLDLNKKNVDITTLDPHEFEHGLNLGVGARLFNTLELGMVYRLIFSEYTWGFGRWTEPDKEQKKQLIASIAVVF